MKKLWILALVVFVFSFAILGYVGVEIFRQAPPIPSSVVTLNGAEFVAPEQISDGQNVWQAMGGNAGRVDLGTWLVRSSRLDR